MRAAYQFLILAMAAIVAALWSVSPEAKAENKSHTGVDHVEITKITPRLGADLPVPCQLPFQLEVQYRLSSAPKGKVRIGLFLWEPGVKGASKTGSSLTGLKQLIKPIEKDIAKGGGVLTLTTDVVTLEAMKSKNCQLLTIVNMHDASKKELCWATSYNFLRGSLSVRKTAEVGARDSIQMMSYYPKLGSLETGKDHSFTFNLQYNLKTKDWAFINLELGEQGSPGTVGPWYSVIVPVKKGAGLIKVTTRKFFMPVAYAGKQMALSVPYRVDALGGTVDVLRYGPWVLKRPETGK